MNKTKIFIGPRMLAGVFCLSAHLVFAQTAAQIEAAQDILAKVPTAELASKSAELVANAPAKLFEDDGLILQLPLEQTADVDFDVGVNRLVIGVPLGFD